MCVRCSSTSFSGCPFGAHPPHWFLAARLLRARSRSIYATLPARRPFEFAADGAAVAQFPSTRAGAVPGDGRRACARRDTSKSAHSVDVASSRVAVSTARDAVAATRQPERDLLLASWSALGGRRERVLDRLGRVRCLELELAPAPLARLERAVRRALGRARRRALSVLSSSVRGPASVVRFGEPRRGRIGDATAIRGDPPHVLGAPRGAAASRARPRRVRRGRSRTSGWSRQAR